MNRDFYGFYGMLFFTLVLPYVPLLLPFMPSSFAGFNMTGWAWILMFMTCIYYFVKNPRFTFPLVFWVPWVVYLFGYLLFDLSFLGLQLSLQYVLPLFVGIVASGFSYGREQYHWLFKWLMIIATVLFLMFMAGHFLGFGTAHWAPTVIFLTIPGAVVLGVYFLTKDLRYLLWYGALFLVPFLIVTRMAILAFIVILLLHFANTRIVSKVFVGLLGAAVLLVVFNSQGFQEKTFFEGEGGLSDISLNYYEADAQMNTSGRSTFYRYFEKGLREAPLFGNGPRADYHVMHSFTGLNDAHNDYLSVRYNYGIVGLVLLLAAFAGTFLVTYRRYRVFRRLKEPYGFLTASTVLVLFLVFAMFMYSDNILKYTIFFPDIFFAMIGMVFSKSQQGIS